VKPETRVKLLKEYERIKTRTEPGSIWWNIFSMIFFTTLFVKMIIGASKNPESQHISVLVILISALILCTIWQSYIITRKIYDKKLLLLLQAILDLPEENIYKEINNLDIKSNNKEENVT
jgi:hypothetical protein